MNTPQHPLIPQGSLLDQKSQGRARVKIAVFFVLAVHGIGLLALLISGCRREEAPSQAEITEPTNAIPAPVFEQTNPIVETAVTPPLGTTAVETTTNPLPPTEPPVVPPSPPATTTEYKVVKGDSFSSIAKKFNVTVRALMDANPGVEPTKLQIDQKILIPPPAPGSTATPAASSTPAATDGTITYEVKSGDTLSRIASQHGTTVRAIRTANNLRTDRIVVGQKLKIPSKANGAPAPQ